MFQNLASTVAAVALALLMSFCTPAVAQDVARPTEPPAVTQDQVLAACTASDATQPTCKSAIAAYFAYLKQTNVTGGDLEQVIAALVVALAEAPVSPDIRTVVVAAIEDIGTNYARGDQAAAIQKIAETVQAGGAGEVVTGALPVSGA